MTAVIYRCSECLCKDLDHAQSDGGHCSMGGCPCTLSADQVARDNPAVQVRTFPAHMPPRGLK